MKKTLVLIALTAISMPAMAGDQNAFYGSLGGGAYRIKSEGFNETAPTTTILGGYNVNANVAFEAAYTKLFDANGTVDGVRVKIDGNEWDLSTRLSMPFGDRFNAYGRLGWSYLDLSAVASAAGFSARVNDYDDGFTWAVGGGLKLNNRYSLHSEYSQVRISDADFDRMSLSLIYRFGSL